jgi:transposase
VQVVYTRCCGLDVHKKTVVACVLITAEDGGVQRIVRTFGTMTADLLALSDWLQQLRITHVAMESTGVYWWPVFNVLEDEERTLLVVNPQHMKAYPGHKTDVKDSEWIADLLRHGLLRPSFIPPAPVRELRDLMRYRKTLVQERTQEINRLHKVLESANIKLAAVATDVMGKSGRAMLSALSAGEEDADVLAELALRSLRKKLPQLRRALEGRVKPHHRLLITQILGHIDYLSAAIAQMQDEVARLQAPFQEAVDLLQTLPGVAEVTAATIIAEIGVDMSRFGSAKHLASWAGVCPGNHQSGGTRRNAKPTDGNPWLQAVLGEVACSLARSRGTYLHEQYHRIARRRGKQKAIVAVAHSVLVIIYHMLRDKRPYQELGADYFDKLDAARIERHHVRRLEQLGYTVTLTPKVAA